MWTDILRVLSDQAVGIQVAVKKGKFKIDKTADTSEWNNMDGLNDGVAAEIAPECFSQVMF